MNVHRVLAVVVLAEELSQAESSVVTDGMQVALNLYYGIIFFTKTMYNWPKVVLLTYPGTTNYSQPVIPCYENR